jgi:hypothetical protein
MVTPRLPLGHRGMCRRKLRGRKGFPLHPRAIPWNAAARIGSGCTHVGQASPAHAVQMAFDHLGRAARGGRQRRHGIEGPQWAGALREETRTLVQSAAERLNFRPNNLAQCLLRKRSFTVGLISTDSHGRFSIPLLQGIEDALEAARISVFLCTAADDLAREHQHVSSLLAKRVDGIIVTGRRTDRRPPLDLGRSRVPR